LRPGTGGQVFRRVPEARAERSASPHGKGPWSLRRGKKLSTMGCVNTISVVY
jgi:hypothetical protein